MTTMQTGGFGTFQQDQMPIEQRTSVLAILSLIFGIVCVPGFGILGAIFGITALFLISNSGGRVAGKGLAAAGIVIGILMTVIWISIAVGMSTFMGKVGQALVQPADTTMKAIEARDYATAKKILVGQTAQKITDADFEAFSKAYHDELGAYKSAPDGMWSYLTEVMQMGQQMQRYQNSGNIIPVPMTFEKEKVIVGWQVSNNSGASPGPNGSIDLPITNIQIITKNGKTITLYDPDNRPLTPPSGSDVPGDAPKPSDPPKPDAPANPSAPK